MTHVASYSPSAKEYPRIQPKVNKGGTYTLPKWCNNNSHDNEREHITLIEKKQIVGKLYFNLPQSPIKKIFFFPSSRLPSLSAKYNEQKGHLWDCLKTKKKLNKTKKPKPQPSQFSLTFLRSIFCEHHRCKNIYNFYLI